MRIAAAIYTDLAADPRARADRFNLIATSAEREDAREMHYYVR